MLDFPLLVIIDKNMIKFRQSKFPTGSVETLVIDNQSGWEYTGQIGSASDDISWFQPDGQPTWSICTRTYTFSRCRLTFRWTLALLARSLYRHMMLLKEELSQQLSPVVSPLSWILGIASSCALPTWPIWHSHRCSCSPNSAWCILEKQKQNRRQCNSCHEMWNERNFSTTPSGYCCC